MLATLFDTETTGLAPNSVISDQHMPRVIEFYACQIDVVTGELINEVDFMCHPGESQLPLDPIITKITKITTEQLRGIPPFSDYLPAVRQILEGSDTVVAHNLAFDKLIIDREFWRNNAPPVVWPRRQICTVEATEWVKGFRLNLTSLHEWLFSEPFPEAHRAKNDVQALTRCFLELVKRDYV